MRGNAQRHSALPAWASIVVVLAVAISSLDGQTAGTGALTATVTDASGAVIPGAAVAAINADTAQQRATTTGADGTSRFTLLPPGTYKVRFAAAGFRTVEVPGLDPTLPASVGSGWGNSGLGILEGPGQLNFDAAALKSTRVGGLTETGVLKFRAEFFNLFNHPRFGNPVNNLALPTIGQIQSTSVNPRLVQLALKYVF